MKKKLSSFFEYGSNNHIRFICKSKSFLNIVYPRVIFFKIKIEKKIDLHMQKKWCLYLFSERQFLRDSLTFITATKNEWSRVLLKPKTSLSWRQRGRRWLVTSEGGRAPTGATPAPAPQRHRVVPAGAVTQLRCCVCGGRRRVGGAEWRGPQGKSRVQFRPPVVSDANAFYCGDLSQFRFLSTIFMIFLPSE